MTRPVFETFWLVNGEQYFDVAEVGRLVIEKNVVAVEVTAEVQLEQWERQQAQEARHAAALERHAQAAQEAAFRESPEGRAAAARQAVSSSGGGIVTVIQPQDAALSELDAFGPDATNVFK